MSQGVIVVVNNITSSQSRWSHLVVNWVLGITFASVFILGYQYWEAISKLEGEVFVSKEWFITCLRILGESVNFGGKFTPNSPEINTDYSYIIMGILDQS